MNLRLPTIPRGVVALVLRRAGWFSAAVAGAALFFCLGLLFRVLLGPVSLGPLNGALHSALGNVVPGLDVRFDDAALEWNREEQHINLVILGTRVFDRGGRIIAQAPKAEIGLAAGPFVRGRIVITRIALVGVQLTLVHTRAGTLRLGIEPARGGEDVLQEIRDALSRGGGAPSSLRIFAVHEARLAFYDEETGAFIVAPGADLQVTSPKEKRESQSGAVSASLAARIEISGKPARVFAKMDFPGRGDLVTGDVSISGLSLPALAADGNAFRFLGPFALTTDISASWMLSHGTALKFADFGIGATGTVNGLGRPLHIKSLRMVGRYDGASGRLLVDDADLSGDEARVHLTGEAGLSFAPGGGLQGSSFALSLDRLALNMPGAMEHAVALGRATLKGLYSIEDKRIVLEQAQFSGGPLAGALAGTIKIASNVSPELDVDGKVDPIEVRDLLRYWPLHLASGTRAWIAEHVATGRIGPVLIHTRIPAGAFDRPAMPDDAISLSFPLVGATVAYLHGLTPITKLVGTGTLTGDTFKGNMASAEVGPLAISQGHVTIANLHVHGAPADVGVRVTGQLPQLLALLDMKPLQYPTRFHVNTQSARGSAAFDASFRIPTIRNVSIDAITISAKGTVNGFALALGSHTHVSDGTLTLTASNARLQAAGKATIGSANLDVDWTEEFEPKGPFSTDLKIRGLLDDAARAAFNLPLGEFISGPVGVDADLDGYRGVIQRASARFDLTQAAMAADMLSLNKAAGVPATAQVSAQLDQNQNLRSADVSIDGQGLAANGSVTFGPGGAIQNLSLPSVRIGSADDFAITLKELTPTGLDLAIVGHSLDASGLGHTSKAGGRAHEAPHESNEPFRISVKVDRLALRNGVVVSPFALEASGQGDRPRSLTASGNLSKTSIVTATISSSDSQRHLAVTSGDAGALIKGLIGPSIMQGGDLNLQATMPSTAQTAHTASDYAGELTIRNCTLLNQSMLARAVSSGSFAGFANLMKGGGIVLDSIHIPFRYGNNVINIHDAHASGTSIGVTADGYVDRDTNQVALQGAIAPLYGLNGLLGAIPVIGDVFVSKKGEGLFGVTYSVRGDLDSPQVSTNPLSVLTPGILRRVFEGTPAPPAASAGSSASTTTPPSH